MNKCVKIIGAGLAGCEAAYQLASRGIFVELYEMRPVKNTGAHRTDYFAELVCSNSLRSMDAFTSSGCLKRELKILDSFILHSAEKNKVPAGNSLAVSRNEFSKEITEIIHNNPNIKVIREEVEFIPAEPAIIATGPLTSEKLYNSISDFIGTENLNYYDATSPIIDASTIDYTKTYFKSRYDKGSADFLNCPMSGEIYNNIVNEINQAPKILKHSFDDIKYFEGCLPVEVMAKRGMDTLKFGPWKPVGLTDDQNIEAVVQLRKDDLYGKTFNIVGFQTQIDHRYQKKIINMIPGLENAEILRYGNIHKNTYINSPLVLTKIFSLKDKPGYYFSGQLTGVEGYVESIASGFYSALSMYSYLNNIEWAGFPEETLIGALGKYVSCGIGEKTFQPSNVQFGLLPPLGKKYRKRIRKEKYSERSLVFLKQHLKDWSFLKLK